MLTQFSVWPLDHPNLLCEVSQVSQILDRIGVQYERGPMGTTFAFDWRTALPRHSAELDRHRSLVTTIVLDDEATRR